MRAVPELSWGAHFSDPSTPRTHMESEPPPQLPGHVSALINLPHYGSNMPWPPRQVTPPPFGHIKTPSPHRTKMCLQPTHPPRIISGTALRISHSKNTSLHPEDFLEILSVCSGNVFSNVRHWYSLDPPHQSALQGKKVVILPSGTPKVTCMHPWDRIGWLAWRWWPCIPTMHSRWTPRPSCRTTGKPQEAVLPVNYAWLTEIHQGLRRTCHQHACFFELLVLTVGFVFLATNLPNLENKHMPFLWSRSCPVPGSHEYSLH